MVMFKIQDGADCRDDLFPPLHFLDGEAATETLGDFPGAPCAAPSMLPASVHLLLRKERIGSGGRSRDRQRKAPWAQQPAARWDLVPLPVSSHSTAEMPAGSKVSQETFRDMSWVDPQGLEGSAKGRGTTRSTWACQV